MIRSKSSFLDKKKHAFPGHFSMCHSSIWALAFSSRMTVLNLCTNTGSCPAFSHSTCWFQYLYPWPSKELWCTLAMNSKWPLSHPFSCPLWWSGWKPYPLLNWSMTYSPTSQYVVLQYGLLPSCPAQLPKFFLQTHKLIRNHIHFNIIALFMDFLWKYFLSIFLWVKVG